MVHSWRAYELAQRIAERLFQMGLVAERDVLKVRGVIQIMMEDEAR